MIAVELIDLINREFGANIPQVDMDDVLCTGGCAGGGTPEVIPGTKAVFSAETVQRLMDTFPLLSDLEARLQGPEAALD